MPIILGNVFLGRGHFVSRIRTPTSRLVTVALCCIVLDCSRGDRESSSTTVQKAQASAQLAKPSSPAAVPASALRGPSIVIDSTAKQARLDRASGELIVRLSPRMARAMYDSFPGFLPLPQSTYGASGSGESDSAYSVVVGDFDGDSLHDVALLGTSRNAPVLFMLLAKADSAGRTIYLIEPASPPDSPAYRLGFVAPQRLQSPDNKDYFVDLRTDAIHLQSESVSSVCYLDHGTLRWFGMAGD